jgi:hypothetical protein
MGAFGMIDPEIENHRQPLPRRWEKGEERRRHDAEADCCE